ncbi:hypothetical protein AZE42_06715 [Rhizopogon vesiculosus]|uniref:Uncharacterized protein n=1 Tax=Rhizopogon vesiculosus TaxID=180088 RepID=A0A1J8Q7Q7_9AGAM|nr:hypothetical protein AZE42_06715 [Rhizopogon vesiculosus]
MASTSTHAAPAAAKEKLTPVKTLEDHEDFIQSMAYFPDGKRIISGSDDKTARQWDMQAGKEIKKERDVCQWEVRAVAVSRNGRWVVIAGGNDDHTELKACEIETGIMKTFRGHSQEIKCIDISPDSTLLASGSRDETVRIWSLVTGKLIAGPFEGVGFMGAIRFSQDSKKLAVSSEVGNGLDVWDVQTQKSDVMFQGKGTMTPAVTQVPLFWTNRETILTAFNFTDHGPITIYEFDASTLKTVGTSFEGHTDIINSIALSFDGALLASSSRDNTIKLWDFESRHLLASFHVLNAKIIIFSPLDSRQLAYTTATYKDDNKIYICNTPADILARTTLPKVRLLTFTNLRCNNLLQKTSATLQDLLEVCVTSICTFMLIGMHHPSLTQPVVLPPCTVIE